MSLPDFFALHPVFTRQALVHHMTKASGRAPKPATVRALLRYHQGSGRLVMVRRGLYASVGPGTTPATSPVDAYLVGSLGCPNGVLGYHTALELHGLAHSTFETVQILVPHSRRGWSFRGVEYKPVQPREALGEAALTMEVEAMDRMGLDLPVTSVARTLVDVLDRPDLGGGWEEIWRSLEGLSLVDGAAVLTYLERLGNATTAALVGYFLEQHQEALGVHESTLEAMEALRPRGRQYLDRSAGGHLAKRWNLIVPVPIRERHWEELR
jgi:predicted transcriptional regulator of viral defense system